uniref:SAP domain-containing ribonucleoprotein n=2 Tax=Lygus hesperus TaxID=30085 RepID=A0A146M8C0_LYGHE
MADSMSEEQTDLNKMKVPDLKKLLKSRGLSIVGNKQELIDRLQSSDAAAEALLEGSEVGDIIDEELDRELDETLDDEPAKEVEETSPLKEEEEKVQVETPPEPAKVEVAPTKEAEKEVVKTEEPEKLKNGTSAEQENPQPKHKRITIGETSVADPDMAARKKARLERFNQTSQSKEGADAKTTSPDALEKRAARFSSESDKTGVTSTIINDPLSNKNKVEITAKTDNGTDKMKKRAERFGILSPAEQKKQMLEKLQARKARFASTATTAPAAATPAGEKTTAAPLPAIKTASSIDEKKRLRAERFKIQS